MTDAPDSAPSEPWRFPSRALITAAITAVAAGAMMLLWLMFLGMGHGARFDLGGFVAIALLIGTAWQLWDAGGDIGLAPAASRTTLVRRVGILIYVLAVACLAIAGWALVMILIS